MKQTNRYHAFLRRLRAGGRSNMYGAIPYLASTFGIDREEAFRIVCAWVDAEASAVAGAAVEAEPPPDAPQSSAPAHSSGRARKQKAARTAPRLAKASRRRAA